MKWISLLAAAGMATAPAPAAGPATSLAAAQVLTPPPFAYAPFTPSAGYVEAGQDEPGYRAWVTRAGWRGTAVAQFHAYLTNSGVAFVAPTWQLLRTASDWRRCGAEPFEVPPTDEWPNIVNTLRYVRDHVVPRIGAVEPVSVFRNAALNRCAGGAPESVHRSMSAIDFVPLAAIDRTTMIRRLCSEHQVEGPRYNAGLGFYTKMRFHVDSWKYRTWGRDDGGHLACPKVEPVAAPLTLARAPADDAAGRAPTSPNAAPTPLPSPASPPVSAAEGDPLSPLPEMPTGR